ncbi:ankyrin repeat-containing domain protein [Aspergillus ambiguus]|uniref:ankyrin repeat-containing domain protein n=1 Tax=Aspergillus ambiguus TaxID=176160 RepID=UPI003CCD499A
MPVDEDPSSVLDTADPDSTAPRLTLVNTVPSQPDKDDRVPDLDIIHVAGVDAGRRLELDTVIGNSVSSRKREFFFQCNVSTLFLGDLVFDGIQDQALQLLNGIADSSTYDKAIAIASSKEQWIGIFYSTVQFVYWDCFQRRRNPGALETKLWQFLEEYIENAPWASLLTPLSVKYLAEISVETTEVFLSSRITLRSRVLSIYSNEDAGADIIFDFFTATLGVSTEIAVQGTPDRHVGSSKHLLILLCADWASSPQWVALQRMLLPLAMPQCQHVIETPEPFPRVVASKAYTDWSTIPRSPVLYIQGRDEKQSKSLADGVLLFHQTKLQERKEYDIPVLSFTFSSQDPTRASIDFLICSALIQVLCAFEANPGRRWAGPFSHLYHIQIGWTMKDLDNLLKIFLLQSISTKALLVLRDIDECEPAARKYLWNLLEDLTERSDSYLKVIVTSRRRLSLLADFGRTSSWYLYDHNENMSDEALTSSTLQQSYPANLVSQLCPAGHGALQVRKALQGLEAINKTSLKQILFLIQRHTNWPDVPSLVGWSSFCTLLDQVHPILRSVPDQEGLRWILTWIVHGHRSLSSREIGYESVSSTTSVEMEQTLQMLKSWLSILVQFGHDKVYDPKYVWNELKPMAHAMMLEFLNFYLTTADVCNRLISMYDRYILLYNDDDNHLIPSVQPDGEDFIFYAITAFPYHLGRYPEALQKLKLIFCSAEQPLTPWARMYWAMTFSVLLSTATVDPILREKVRAMATTFTSGELPNTPLNPNDDVSMDTLMWAVSVGNEDAALKTAHDIILARTLGGKTPGEYDSTTAESGVGDTKWLSKLLWRATWLNMDRLVGLLLEAKVPPDPKDVVSAQYPSPLYLASLLGHSRIVQALLEAGADSPGLGQSDTIRALVNQDGGLLKMEHYPTPLYIASFSGKWTTVKTLIDLGAPVDFNPSSDDLTPLLVAASHGHTRTVRILLENHASPTMGEPGDRDPPLWFATFLGESVDCVRLLLEHGADPNHELSQPPLVVEMCMDPDISIEKIIAILDALVDNTPPVDIDKVDSNGNSGLMWAASTGNTALVEWLLAHDASVGTTNNEQKSAMHYAVINGHEQVIQKLLLKKPPLDTLTGDGRTLLELSIDRGLKQIGMLLEAGANPELENVHGETVLDAAVIKENPEVVKYLIDRKVNIQHRNASGWKPIHVASGHRPNAEVVRLLADAGASLTETTSKDGQSPLHIAANVCRPDIVAILLEFRGALDIEQRDGDGETPLISAVYGGDLECIRRLLRAGADINAQSSDGWTPLMVAMLLDEPYEVISFLLARPDLDISRSSSKDGSALHLACSFLDLGSVTVLLDKGADVNQQLPGFGPTPLMEACMPDISVDARNEFVHDIDQIVRTLVANGADVHATYRWPFSTLLCAASLYSGPSTINYLVSEGLQLNERDCLNRLPIHYAAANGREVFETALLGDSTLLSEDVGGKTALHWAAQFGHVQTVEIILARERSSEDRHRRLNESDIDGWTALHWALRPERELRPERYSEPYDIPQTVQFLIESGADVSRSCRMGREDETFTVLELAKLHRASDEILGLLREAGAMEDKTRRLIRPYEEGEEFRQCHICWNTIWGPVLQCETCSHFHVCKKCHGNIDIYHGYLKQETGEPHTFRVIVEALPEIQEPLESEDQPSDGDSKGRPDGHSSPPGSEHGDATVVVDPKMEAIMNFSVDDDFDITLDVERGP